MPPDLVVFIITNGRPGSVVTDKTLRRCGYTGKIYYLVDNLDPSVPEYVRRYGELVIVFDKERQYELADCADNFHNLRSTTYVRNAAFEVARDLGVKNFLVLDDDYRSFDFRYDASLKYHRKTKPIGNMNVIIGRLLKFFLDTNCLTLSICQGGDFIGGHNSKMAQSVRLIRKCMNFFICSTDRPFKFLGRLNEDVNTYVRLGSSGSLMLCTNQISLGQSRTQSVAGGMTDAYLTSGTYVKSFYSVMYQPSSVKIALLNSEHPRLHHRIEWNRTVPCIVSEAIRKRSFAGPPGLEPGTDSLTGNCSTD